LRKWIEQEESEGRLTGEGIGESQSYDVIRLPVGLRIEYQKSEETVKKSWGSILRLTLLRGRKTKKEDEERRRGQRTLKCNKKERKTWAMC